MVVHWDDVEESLRAHGHIRATRQRLGAAAGAHTIGASRWRIGAGDVCSPAHVHADEEEIFFVLDGAGFAWQDGRSFPVSAGDVLVFPAGGAPHTIFGGPIDVLAFASGSTTGLTWVQRANMLLAKPRWIPLESEHPFAVEARLGPLAPGEVVDPADERPPWIVGISDVEGMPVTRGRTDQTLTDLGRGGGARAAGLVHVVIAPGAYGNPPHCHSAEEELFVVLDGEGHLELHEPDAVVRWPLRRGSVVARPPGTGVSHAFRAGTDGPLTLLAYGQRDTGDTCFYPHDGSVRLQGLGRLRFRVEPVDDRDAPW
jgi:uncharacterized cupin superfamily protein